MNLLAELTPQNLASRSLSWENPPQSWQPLPGGGMRVFVQPRVDYFQDPAGTHVKDDAPYLWQPVQGDFVAQAHLRPTFATTWDAGALMARPPRQETRPRGDRAACPPQSGRAGTR